MQAWDIFTWDFPAIGPHPAVVLGNNDRVKNKPTVNVLLCSSRRATRQPDVYEVMLDHSDGLDWETLCKCDLLYAAPAEELTRKRGVVALQRRREISARVIRGLGLAGL